MAPHGGTSGAACPGGQSSRGPELSDWYEDPRAALARAADPAASDELVSAHSSLRRVPTCHNHHNSAVAQGCAT